MTTTLTPIPGATLRHDDGGNPIIDIATCGSCGRSWNDAASSGITPAPSGRCPFEYEHDEPDEQEMRREVMREIRALARDAMAGGLTDHGDVIEEVAAWEIAD